MASQGAATVARHRGAARRAARADRRIRDEDVVADGAHRFGLERRCACEPDRATLQLFSGNPRRFVRFDMWAQAEAVFGCVLGRAVEISCEPIEVDDRNRGLEIGDFQRHVMTILIQRRR